jgi:4-hydroxy-2-oxoheptanedioate aldolase
MRINTVKQKLLQGNPAFGAEAAMGSALVAEALASAGVDFVSVDNQHGQWSHERMLHAFRGICLGGAMPMARVQHNHYAEIGSVLDLGALGIVVPMVNSAAEAARAVRAAFYPPFGDRSNGAVGVGIHADTQAEYIARIREQALIIVMIETREGLERAAEIFAVEGVDGCMIGPSDLGLSLDVAFGSDEHETAILQILETCRQAGKIPGIAAWGTERNAPERRAAQGFLYIQATSDREIVPNGARAILARARDGGTAATMVSAY